MSTFQADASSHLAHGPRLLLVDDQPDILELLGLLLQSEGFTVVTAEDGEAALAEARRSRFDAFVFDVSMPKMDGVELALTLRAEQATRDVPVLFHSSLLESEVRARFAGYAGYLRKPVDPIRIITMLRNTLHEPAASPFP